MNEKLRELAKKAEKHGPKTITIQAPLRCYDRERRSTELCSMIRSDLYALELTTRPSFSSSKWPLDRKIRLRPMTP